MNASKPFLALGTALLLGASSLLAQSTGTTSGGTTTGSTSTRPTPTTSTGAANPHTANPNASERAKDVQAALQKFDAERDAYIAERKALLDKLAAAKTEAERKAILEEIRAAKADRPQLGKEMREELKKLREQRKGGG